MRTIKYLSPTAVAQFYADRTEFYLQRLAENRPDKIPQTRPMSVGSAFDAYVKSFLHEKLYGTKDERFVFQNIFEAQVEEQNRDWALAAGLHCFNVYKDCGALAALLLELSVASHAPRLEFTVEGQLSYMGTVVPMLGKPDIYFVTKEGAHIILDFKVNGYCGKGTTSPSPGYVMVRGGWGRGNGAAHKDAQIMRIGGIGVNVAVPLEGIDEDWAGQTCDYAWILGEEVGSKFVVGIEQLACKAGEPRPDIRVASFRHRVSEAYQRMRAEKLVRMWNCLVSGHIFDDLTRGESDERCKMLDGYAGGLAAGDDWFKQVTRQEADRW